MKKLLFLFVFVSVALSGCKKDSDEPAPSTADKLSANMNVLHDALQLYIETLQQSGDSVLAFMELNNFLVNHPQVAGGTFHNLTSIEVEFANGLRSPINFIPVDENGRHLTRGGGGGSPVAYRMSEIQTENIKNNKILFIIPYPEEFYYDALLIADLRNLAESGDVEMDVDFEVGIHADFDDLNRLSEYGLIIIDVHGNKDGFYMAHVTERFYGDNPWSPEIGEQIINETFNVQSIPQDKVESGEIRVGPTVSNWSTGVVEFQYRIFVTEKYIRNLNIDLTDAVLFGNYCYSGHTADGTTTNNMPAAWRSKGLATYYGYADIEGYASVVDDQFCHDMEWHLIQNLVADRDSTGEAHLKADGSENFYVPALGYNRASRPLTELTEPPAATQVWPLYLRQYYSQVHQYDNCGAMLIDPRDGEQYQTVCIGNRVWMAENLRYDAPGSVCYDNDLENCETYGRLYDHETALTACPPGWRLPFENEWAPMWMNFGPGETAGGALKADTLWALPNTGATNESGWTGLPGGYFDAQYDNAFENITLWGYWWSYETNGSIAVPFSLRYDDDIAYLQSTNIFSRQNKVSCRCIKNE
ncbi:MAG: hypothetical protein H6602_13475 [Flavobacteriales bacterium]|nr:hypothetical protein [Flavobacteriales bacterium]